MLLIMGGGVGAPTPTPRVGLGDLGPQKTLLAPQVSADTVNYAAHLAPFPRQYIVQVTGVDLVKFLQNP
jgi:hypothetical protein